MKTAEPGHDKEKSKRKMSLLHAQKLAHNEALMNLSWAHYRNQKVHDQKNGLYNPDEDVFSSSTWLISLAQARAEIGALTDIERLIEDIYTISPKRTDVYARCAWKYFWPRKEYNELVNWMEKDLSADRLSPTWMLNLAQVFAAMGEIDRCWPMVEKAYQTQSDLANGYARCAWQWFWPRKEFAQVISWMEKDRAYGRLTGVWLLNLALAFAANKECYRSWTIIETAYQSDPSLKDGYSRCAWLSFWSKGEYSSLIPWLEKDLASDRISGEWLLNLAWAYSASGEIERSWPLIEQAYGKYAQLKDGYARSAWFYYWPRREYGSLIAWLEKERGAERLSPLWLLNLAQVYAAKDEVSKSWPLVVQAYEADSGLTDGYARCAWYYFWDRKDYETLMIWMEKDRSGGRLSPKWSLRLAQVYAALGKSEKSWPMIEKAYSQDKTLVDGYVKSAWYYYWPKKEYKSQIRWMERDLIGDRISAVWLLNLAQVYAAHNDIEKAWPLVERAYREDANLRNGYARCAWYCHWPQQEYDQLIHWMNKDLDRGKLSGLWRYNLALVYAVCGEMAKCRPLIDKAIHEDPQLTNSYSRCAWYAFHPRWPKMAYASIVKWMETDYRAGKMTPFWMLRLAQAYAANDQFELALSVVRTAYDMDAHLTDGYILAAWQYYWPKWPRIEASKMLPWMEMDYRSGRITSTGYLKMSQAYAAQNDLVSAMKMVNRA